MKSFFTGTLSLRASGASKKGVQEEVGDLGGSHQGGEELQVLGWLRSPAERYNERGRPLKF